MGRKFFNDDPIPKHLDHKEWNSHKGIIAKLVKSTRKTGITEALKALEEHYNFQGSWGYWGDSEIAGNARWALSTDKGEKELGLKQLQLGLDAIPKFLQGCKTKLDAIKDLAKKAAPEFKKSKLIPSSSTAFLDDMVKACDTFYNKVKTNLDAVERKIKEARKKAGITT
jgi:hypothetical protein